jgi:S-adenosylmethionine:tRNA ribosyltransferase-isomerase
VAIFADTVVPQKYMLQKSDFHYKLPPELIAHTPLAQRDASKLLVLNKNTGEIIHSNFRVLPSFLQKGDVLVRNNSKVLKARIFGYKLPTGGKIEILLNKLVITSTDSCIWDCIVRPGIAVGQQLSFGEGKLLAECVGVSSVHYTRQILFRVSLSEFYGLLEQLGETPLPPYIDPQRAAAEVEASVHNHSAATLSTVSKSAKKTTEDALFERYQTTYAREFGSVAAPTAGLHFTPQVDAELRARGVEIHEVTLHVGLGTFLPVKTEVITEHVMHAEQFTLTPETATALNRAKAEGRRIIAVGTTTCRVLESCATLPDRTAAADTAAQTRVTQDSLPAHYHLQPQSSETAIFIYPPYRFKFIDGLITNFHLPESTLLMLISALVSQPNTKHAFTNFTASSVGNAYAEAIRENYRFFSFGDSMFIS